MKKLITSLVAAVLVAAVMMPSAGAAPGESGPRPDIDIQILNVSDFHGQLESLSVFGVGNVGGASILSTLWNEDRAANPNTITLTAGDAFGGSIPLSNFFNEEPTVLAMNAMGFSADGLGNHNFDKGIDHLQSMIDIAEFPYISANLKNVNDNLTGVKPYEIFDFGRVQVAVIGVTNPEAPTLVFPGNFGTIEVTDPVAAVRQARKRAHAEGADVFVINAHMGVTAIDGDGVPSGPIVDLANALKSKDYDLILADHTNLQFNGEVNGITLVENQSRGATYSRINITVDQNNRKIRNINVEQIVPLADGITPDPTIEAILQPFRDALGPILNASVGSSTVFIPRSDSCGQSSGRLCESLVGNVTTDSLRAAYGTDFALTNAGGLRSDLTCPTTDNPSDFCPAYTPPPFPITLGQVITVLPFGNESATLTVDGAELKAFLENGVSALPAASGRFAQVSGLCFTFDINAAAGSRVLGAVRQMPNGSCTGAAVDLTAGTNYTLATNDFVLNGGDGYPALIARATTRNLMDQDLGDYVTANSPISPSIQGRIICTTSGAVACPVMLP